LGVGIRYPGGGDLKIGQKGITGRALGQGEDAAGQLRFWKSIKRLRRGCRISGPVRMKPTTLEKRYRRGGEEILRLMGD